VRVSAVALPHSRRVFSWNFSQEKSHYSNSSRCRISMIVVLSNRFCRPFPSNYFFRLAALSHRLFNANLFGKENVDSYQGPMLWFLKYFRQKFLRTNLRFWLKTKINFEKNYHNIGFWKKRQFFRRKLSKIAENCDHNIDPGIAKCYICITKIPLWVNFVGPRNEKTWYILYSFGMLLYVQFGTFNDNLIYFDVIWYFPQF
jgi:hypothetical protein